ncbi:hypothetical protein FKP32DRAFT_1587483 [Trametes sanguinea]|nr:hypothetical protein FKP32DRAFT_1587483 [Trametes sanguinea]
MQIENRTGVFANPAVSKPLTDSAKSSHCLLLAFPGIAYASLIVFLLSSVSL